MADTKRVDQEGGAVVSAYAELGEPTRHERPARTYPPGLLGIPCHRDLPVESAEAIFALAHTGLPTGSAVIWSYGPSTIAANRNRIVRTLLRSRRLRDLEWLCLCDADAKPPANAILRLLDRATDVVGALYCLREPPYKFGFGRPMQPTPEPMELTGMLSVAWVGTHFLLIRRRVLERMKPPWFDHVDAAGKPTPGYGEDVYFSRKARAAGFEVAVDLDVWAGHMAWQEITPETALAFGKSGLYRVAAEELPAQSPPIAAAGD